MKPRVAFFALILLLLLAVPAPAEEQKAPPQAAEQKAQVYSGNIQSRKFHNSGCRWFACKACVVRFSSPEEARSKGYVACKVCGG